MALCIQTACRGGGRGRWVCRDADKTSLKRDDQHRKKPSSSLPSQFPAKLVYFWPGQNICGATATFTPFFAPPGYFYCLTLQRLPARMRWENTHAPFCLRWKRPVYNWSAILLISNVCILPAREVDFYASQKIHPAVCESAKICSSIPSGCIAAWLALFLYICCFREFV